MGTFLNFGKFPPKDVRSEEEEEEEEEWEIRMLPQGIF